MKYRCDSLLIKMTADSRDFVTKVSFFEIHRIFGRFPYLTVNYSVCFAVMKR